MSSMVIAHCYNCDIPTENAVGGTYRCPKCGALWVRPNFKSMPITGSTTSITIGSGTVTGTINGQTQTGVICTDHFKVCADRLKEEYPTEPEKKEVDWFSINRMF